MLTIDQVKAALQDRRIDLVASASGVGYSTVRDIRSGANTNPTYETLAKLSAYLQGGAVVEGSP